MSAAVGDIKTYEDWKQSALAHDARSGASRWRQRDESNLYDYRVIRRRLSELSEVRASGDLQRLLFYLHEGFHGNMAGMGAPALYTRAKFGTKQLITDYLNEIREALQDLERAPEEQITLHEKFEFFKRCSVCFGRSALMLSGAGSLGPFHIGVVKALSEQGLLPSIISGASAGSIVTAVAGTRTQEELSHMLSDNEIVNAMTMADGEVRHGRRIRKEDLDNLVCELIPDLTFEEALAQTGRYINVSVAPTALNQRSRLLNAIVSPNACIREAVIASCSIPGVFPPVTLAAKDKDGNRKPYIATRKWADGSITDDLPARRLTRLYGVNHFISSQANPMVLWALQDPHSPSVFAQLTSVYQSAVRDWSRAVYPVTMKMVRNIYPVNIMTRMWFGLLSQEYTADINISPSTRWFNPAKLLAALTPEETMALIDAGEKATWPKIEMIRNCTEVSRYIDGALHRLEERATAVPEYH